MAKKKSKKVSMGGAVPSATHQSIRLEKASNGFVINMSKTLKSGKYVDKTFIAKTKQEASKIASKLF